MKAVRLAACAGARLWGRRGPVAAGRAWDGLRLRVVRIDVLRLVPFALTTAALRRCKGGGRGRGSCSLSCKLLFHKSYSLDLAAGWLISWRTHDPCFC